MKSETWAALRGRSNEFVGRHDYQYGYALIGKVERKGVSYIRRDQWNPYPETIARYAEVGHVLAAEGNLDTVHAAGPGDVSRQHSSAQYDAKCSCCYLGHCHTDDFHRQNVEKDPR